MSAARRYRNRPSELLHIADAYIAYCLDEAGAYILAQLEAGKRPFFRPDSPDGGGQPRTDAGTAVNRQTVELMKRLGAEVTEHD